MTLLDQMRSLIIKHCDTLRSEADEIAAALSAWVPGDLPPASLINAVHKIKGSSGTIGFCEVSDQAHVLERLLRGMVHADQDTLAGIHRSASHKFSILLILIRDLHPEDSKLFNDKRLEK